MDPDLIPASEMKDQIPGTSDQYWATLRHKGTGPVYTKVGPRKVYYRRVDLEKWLRDNRFTRPDRQVTDTDQDVAADLVTPLRRD